MPRQDPRRTDSPQTPNEIALDRAVRHALYLEGYKTREAADLLERLEGPLYLAVLQIVRVGLRGTRRRGLARGPRNSVRLRAMRRLIRETAREQIRLAARELRLNLRGLSQQEAEHAVGTLALALSISRERLNEPTGVADETAARTFEGASYTEHFETAATSLIRDTERQVQLGIARDEDDEFIIAGLTAERGGAFNKSRAALSGLVAAAVDHVSAQSREMAWAANAARVTGVQWVATLDSRTCLECFGLDGQRFPVGSGRRPPAHTNCRCTTKPVILGVPAAPELTAQEWLSRQSTEIQNQALGPTRARAFRAGEFNVRDFTDMRGRVLTLDELRAMEPDAFSGTSAPNR